MLKKSGITASQRNRKLLQSREEQSTGTDQAHTEDAWSKEQTEHLARGSQLDL